MSNGKIIKLTTGKPDDRPLFGMDAEFYREIEELEEKDKSRFILAIVECSFRNEEPDFSDNEKLEEMFRRFKARSDELLAEHKSGGKQ